MAVIYVVECIHNKMGYVGCTKSTLNRRFNEHIYLLRKKKHTAKKMLEDFEKHGRDGFQIVVLQKLGNDASVDLKRKSELAWMKKYEDQSLLYNDQMISFQPGAGWLEKAHTPEANMKRRMAQLGKPKGHGDKISATKKRLGQRPSHEAVMKGNKAMLIARYGTKKD